MTDLRALLQEATLGPWRACSWASDDWTGTTASVALIEDDEVRSVAPGAIPARPHVDAHLIAALRNAAPYLLDVVEAARVVAEADWQRAGSGLSARDTCRAALAALDKHLAAKP
jgi:hypothetical protein